MDVRSQINCLLAKNLQNFLKGAGKQYLRDEMSGKQLKENLIPPFKVIVNCVSGTDLKDLEEHKNGLGFISSQIRHICSIK